MLLVDRGIPDLRIGPGDRTVLPVFCIRKLSNWPNVSCHFWAKAGLGFRGAHGHPGCLGHREPVQAWLFAGSHLSPPPLALGGTLSYKGQPPVSVTQAYSLRTWKQEDPKAATWLTSGDSGLSPWPPHAQMWSGGSKGRLPLYGPRAGCCPTRVISESPSSPVR